MADPPNDRQAPSGGGDAPRLYLVVKGVKFPRPGLETYFAQSGTGPPPTRADPHCSCDQVAGVYCSCNKVCRCVPACSCVGYVNCGCVGHVGCGCVGHASCPCVSHTSCGCVGHTGCGCVGHRSGGSRVTGCRCAPVH